MGFTVQLWQQVYDDSFFLYEKIREAKFKPDVIIGIARGGWIPARLIADFLFLKNTENVKAEAYQLVEQKEVEAKITQTISGNIEGKNILVIDDVVDSGATLQAVLDMLSSHNPATIKTASLYYKPRSTIVPDFYVHHTKDWVIFSWSVYETVKDLTDRWLVEGMKVNDIIYKFKDIGIPPTIINSYFDS